MTGKLLKWNGPYSHGLIRKLMRIVLMKMMTAECRAHSKLNVMSEPSFVDFSDFVVAEFASRFGWHRNVKNPLKLFPVVFLGGHALDHKPP
jgi:hypothetical protein